MTGPARAALAPTCPHDDTPLQPVQATPSTPPWWCTSCSRLWWDAQLTETACRRWDRALGGYRPGRGVGVMLDAVRGQADQRRTDARDRRRS